MDGRQTNFQLKVNLEAIILAAMFTKFFESFLSAGSEATNLDVIIWSQISAGQFENSLIMVGRLYEAGQNQSEVSNWPAV